VPAPILLYTVAGLLVLALGLVLARRWLRRLARQSLLRFRARLDRYKLTGRQAVRAELLADPGVQAAIEAHAAARGEPPARVAARVEAYVDEIVPFFSVLSYYRVGYTLARLVTRLFYRVSVEHQDHEALNRIPRRDVVVYVMNHRSNMDYVVVSYVLAGVVSISYAVGEWARTWPLEYIFKSFGSYFIRRRYREPLYHAVLERYVQLITRNRVTQGVFPEGGLSRDGSLRPPKIGLFDYLLGTLRDPAFDADIHVVPVAINYDRVLEDRTLTRELVPDAPRWPRWRQVLGIAGFLGANLLRMVTLQRRRYGRVAVSFGTPLSARAWFGREAPGALALERSERLPHVARFVAAAMERVGEILPVTPVPLAAAALLGCAGSVVPEAVLFERLRVLRRRLRQFNARIVREELPVEEVWERAWRTFRARRWVVRDRSHFVILPGARPLLEYYANSIRHLLPAEGRWDLSPALGPDPSLPRLAPPA
jgi:glycerol-3-phosphate O-acyltransferase